MDSLTNENEMRDSKIPGVCKEKVISQKSILAGRVLQLTDAEREPLRDLSEDFNCYNNLINCDPCLISRSMGSNILGD